MNRILTSELSEMSMGSSVVEASSNLSFAGRVNPWKGRAVMSTNANEAADRHSNAAIHSHDVNVEGSTEKLFEADAWPEPSAPFEHRVQVSSVGAKTADDKPKSKKFGRKWQNIEIEFATSRGCGGGRGGVRMPPGVVNSNHHSPTSLPTNYSASYTFPRGSNRRGGPVPNGSFNRGRGGRSINGYYQSRPSLRTPDQSVVQETLSDVSEPNNTSTAFVGGASRGSYSSRGRRNGFRGTGYTSANYGASVSQSNSSTSMTVPQQVSVATATAAAAAQVMPSLPAVGPVAYLFPNMVVPAPTVFPIPAITETAVKYGDTVSSQTAVLSHQPSPQACLVSPVPSLPAPSNQFSENITLYELLEFLNEYGWSKARIPNHFRRNPAVAAAMEAAVLVAATGDEIKVEFSGDAASAAEKREDIIVVDDKFYIVPLNSHLTKFLKFDSKQNYIRHHVEYYFSETNLQRDEHLMKLISMNKYTCPLGALLNFNRLRYVNTSEDELIQSVMLSSKVSVVYDDQQRAVGVAPQNPSLLKSATSTANHPTSCDTTAQQTTQASDPQQPRSSEAESSQVLTSIDSAGCLPFMLSTGIAAPSTPGLPLNGNHIFQHPQFLPFSSVPTLPLYYNTPALPGAIGSSAAGDHAFTMNTGGAAENAAMYYRPLWPSPSAYPQTPASFLPFFASQNQPFYVSLLQPNVAGLGSGVASIHNNMLRNPPPAFLPTPFSVPIAQLPIQQQRTFAASVRAPHRPPSNQPMSEDNPIIDEAGRNA